MAGRVEVTPPTGLVVSIDDLQAHCRLEAMGNEGVIDYALLTTYALAAQRWIESHTHRRLLTQTWQYWLDAVPSGSTLVLPDTPIQSVTSITSYSLTDVATVMSATTDYRADLYRDPPRIVLRDTGAWPSTTLREVNALVVQYVAGYASAALVPVELQHAIKLLVAHWYAMREPITETALSLVPVAGRETSVLESLLGPWRLWTVA